MLHLATYVNILKVVKDRVYVYNTTLYRFDTHYDKKIIDRLSTHYQPFYWFSLIRVFF